jgi:hypothetical protein
MAAAQRSATAQLKFNLELFLTWISGKVFIKKFGKLSRISFGVSDKCQNFSAS